MTKFRHLIWMSMATLGLILSASQSFAQGTERGDRMFTVMAERSATAINDLDALSLLEEGKGN